MNETLGWTILTIITVLLLILDDFKFDINFNFAIVERKPFLNIINLNSNG